MAAAVRLVAYLLTLAVVFTGSFAVARAVAPEVERPPAQHQPAPHGPADSPGRPGDHQGVGEHEGTGRP